MRAPSTALAVAAAALVLAALVGAGISLPAYARRLDRLHRRAGAGVLALDAALSRRAGAAEALARCAALTGTALPGTAPLLDAAARVRAAEGEDLRAQAESDLSALLRAALDPSACTALARDPRAAPALAELAAACERVVLARRIANDAAVQAQRVRAKRLVRWARLAGRAPLPATVELDDEPPPALAASAAALPSRP